MNKYQTFAATMEKLKVEYKECFAIELKIWQNKINVCNNICLPEVRPREEVQELLLALKVHCLEIKEEESQSFTIISPNSVLTFWKLSMKDVKVSAKGKSVRNVKVLG